MRTLLTAAAVTAAVLLTPAAASAAPVIEEDDVDYGVFGEVCSYAACDGADWSIPEWVAFRPLAVWAYEATR